MDQQKIDEIQKALLAEREELNRVIEAVQGGGLAEPMQDAFSELSSYDNHPADMGSEMFERSKDLSLRENARIQKQDVEEALISIENGTYGNCLSCGREIPIERLEAMPSTSLCLDCKEDKESLFDRHIRPVEEDVLFPPFGRSFNDGEDSIIYDGEDAWQEVAQYGTAESPQDFEEPGEFYVDNNIGSSRVAIMPNPDEDRGSTEDIDNMAVDENDVIPFSTLHGRKK